MPEFDFHAKRSPFIIYALAFAVIMIIMTVVAIGLNIDRVTALTKKTEAIVVGQVYALEPDPWCDSQRVRVTEVRDGNVRYEHPSGLDPRVLDESSTSIKSFTSLYRLDSYHCWQGLLISNKAAQ